MNARKRRGWGTGAVRKTRRKMKKTGDGEVEYE